MERDRGRLDAVMRRYVRWIVRRRVLVIAGLAAVSLFLGVHVARLKVEVDTARFIPQDHPYVVAQNELERLFAGRDVVVIGVIPRNGDIFRPAVLGKVRRITEKLEAAPGAVRGSVLSLTARRARAVRGMADGMDIHPLLPEADPGPEALARLRQDLAANPLFQDLVISPDGGAAQIIAEFRVGESLPDYPALERLIRAIVEPERDAETAIAVGGLPIALSWLAAYSERIAWIFPAVVLLIGLLHYHAFRTLQGFFIPLLTALLAVVWALGFMGLRRVPIDPFSAATPILVLAIAAGHSVQILKRYYEEYDRLRDNHRAVLESTARIGSVMVAAGLISAAAFFSLAVFRTQVMRTFGIFTGIGILSALAIEMTLIPALRAALPAPRERERARERTRSVLDVGLERLAGRIGRAEPRRVLVAGGVAVAVVVVGVLRVEVDNGMKKWYLESTALIQDDRLLNARFGGTNTLNFLIEGQQPDALKDPRALAAVEGLQRFLGSLPGVGKTLSVVDFVKQMHRALHPGATDPRGIPASREHVAQYLLLYAMGGDPGDLDAYVDPEHRRANLQVFARDDSTAFTRHLLARVDEHVRAHFPAGIAVRPAGPMAYTLALNEAMAHGKVQNIVQVGAIIFLISALLFRSLAGGALVLLPLAVTVVVNFALLGFSRTPLDIPTSAIMGVAVGLGADFAIYFLFRFREEFARSSGMAGALFATMTTSGKAITYVSTAVCVGYLALVASGFGIHLRTAFLMSSAIAVSCLATLVLLPPLLALARPRFAFGPASPAAVPLRAPSASR